MQIKLVMLLTSTAVAFSHNGVSQQPDENKAAQDFTTNFENLCYTRCGSAYYLGPIRIEPGACRCSE